jgi:hypothetical protein
MELAMKNAEDEAFDELARKQGDWGGGFQAKRRMAADKLQEPWNEDEWRRNNWRCQHGWLRGEQCEICNASLAPKPAQEPIYKITVTDNAHPKGIPFEDWVQPAQEADILTIAYQSGYYDGKKAALAGREWNFCERCGKRTADLSAIHTCTPPQQEAIYGMNQDDWKDVVAAITKVRDGRGIYLGCRPADVFKDWFLALGTAKVKEKNNG